VNITATPPVKEPLSEQCYNTNQVDVQIMKWRITVLGLLGALCLGACSSAATRRVPLTLWLDTNDKEMLFFKQAIHRLEKDLPHLKVRLRFIPFDNLKPRFLGQVSESREPDILYMMNDWVGELAEQQLLKPLNQNFGELIPQAVASMRYQNQYYGAPFVFQTLAMVYNQDLVSEPPADFEALRHLNAKKTRKDQYTLIYDQRNFYYHAPWFHACGGRLFDDKGRFALQRAPLLRSLQESYALQSQGIVPQGASYSVMVNLFAAGQSSLMLTGPWSLAVVAENQLNYGVAALPQNSCGQPPQAFIGVKGFGVNRMSAYPKAAEDVIGYLTAYATQAAVLQELDNLPVHKKVYSQSLNPYQAAFYAQLKTGVPLPNHPMMKHVWQEMNWLLGQVFDGQPLQTKLDEALQRLQRRAREYEEI